LPSARATVIVSGLKAPAFGLSVARPKPGAKGRSASVFGHSPPPGRALRAKSPVGVAGGSVEGPSSVPAGAIPCAEDQGVICDAVVFGPQVGGLVSGACAPPSNLTRKLLNGTCGRPGIGMLPSGASSKVVVSCPVCGSALTLPRSRAEMS
jgi:hypothetical protein